MLVSARELSLKTKSTLQRLYLKIKCSTCAQFCSHLLGGLQFSNKVSSMFHSFSPSFFLFACSPFSRQNVCAVANFFKYSRYLLRQPKTDKIGFGLRCVVNSILVTTPYHFIKSHYKYSIFGCVTLSLQAETLLFNQIDVNPICKWLTLFIE